MRTGLLATAAALALITAGAASAQDLKKNEAPAPAPGAQQKAPAEKVAPDMHAGDRKLPETTGQASQPAEPEKSGTLHKSDSLNKSPATGDAQTKSGDKAAAQDGASPSTKSSESTSTRSTTTGQGAAAGAAKLSTEQRTKISSIIREHKTPSVHLNVSVSVGTRVPTNVHLYPLPVQVVTVYPEWRGYDYVMVGEDIVVIDPRTHEIVAIIEA